MLLLLINEDKTIQLFIWEAENENCNSVFGLIIFKQGASLSLTQVIMKACLFAVSIFQTQKNRGISWTFPVFHNHKAWLSSNIVSLSFFFFFPQDQWYAFITENSEELYISQVRPTLWNSLLRILVDIVSTKSVEPFTKRGINLFLLKDINIS